MYPFIDLKAQYARIRDAVDANIHAVLDSSQYVLGPAVAKAEEELAAFTGAKHAITVSSGTDAIIMALMALEPGENDAVFVPAFTYTATAEAIIMAKCTPVFVDIDEKSFNIDPDHLEEKIREVRQTGKLTPRAVLAVDLFGQPADYSRINAIAEREGLFVIADAAQALGGAQDNRKVGTLTKCTATSFYPSKPLGCYGDGGAIFTDDDALADVLKSIRVHGEGATRYEVARIGVNGRFDAIQAAVISAKLPIFQDELDSRERIARIYDERLSGHVDTPWRVPGATSAWAQYTIKTDDREAFRDRATAAGVPTMVFYPSPMHFQPAYRHYGEGEGSLPVSERVCHQVVSLPMHPYMDDETTHAICDHLVNS